MNLGAMSPVVSKVRLDNGEKLEMMRCEMKLEERGCARGVKREMETLIWGVFILTTKLPICLSCIKS